MLQITKNRQHEKVERRVKQQIPQKKNEIVEKLRFYNVGEWSQAVPISLHDSDNVLDRSWWFLVAFSQRKTLTILLSSRVTILFCLLFVTMMVSNKKTAGTSPPPPWSVVRLMFVVITTIGLIIQMVLMNSAEGSNFRSGSGSSSSQLPFFLFENFFAAFEVVDSKSNGTMKTISATSTAATAKTDVETKDDARRPSTAETTSSMKTGRNSNTTTVGIGMDSTTISNTSIDTPYGYLTVANSADRHTNYRTQIPPDLIVNGKNFEVVEGGYNENNVSNNHYDLIFVGYFPSNSVKGHPYYKISPVASGETRQWNTYLLAALSLGKRIFVTRYVRHLPPSSQIQDIPIFADCADVNRALAYIRTSTSNNTTTTNDADTNTPTTTKDHTKCVVHTSYWCGCGKLLDVHVNQGSMHKLSVFSPEQLGFRSSIPPNQQHNIGMVTQLYQDDDDDDEEAKKDEIVDDAPSRQSRVVANSNQKAVPPYTFFYCKYSEKDGNNTNTESKRNGGKNDISKTPSWVHNTTFWRYVVEDIKIRVISMCCNEAQQQAGVECMVKEEPQNDGILRKNNDGTGGNKKKTKIGIAEFNQLIHGAKFMLTMGFTNDSPTPIDSLNLGTPLILMKGQHKFLERYNHPNITLIGDPNNDSEVLQAIDDHVNNNNDNYNNGVAPVDGFHGISIRSKMKSLIETVEKECIASS